MGMLVGAYVIRFVPEVASWLIPGGISSSAASVSGAVATGAVMGTIGGVASAGVRAGTGTAGMIMKE